MKRILFFVSSMEGGGAERVAALLCNDWVARGHAVTLVATYSGRGGCSYRLLPGVRLVYLADLVGTTRRSAVTALRRLAAMRALIRECRPDGVVAFLPPVNVAAILAAVGLRVPLIVSERIYPPALPLSLSWRLARRLTYPRAWAVVMQTQQGLAWLRHEIPRARGAVIPNPCVHPMTDGAPVIRPDTVVDCRLPVLLSAGRLTAQKDFARLLTAFARVAGDHPDWHLVILGEGEARGDLERQRAHLGLTARIHLPGHAGNMSAWYARAAAYAQTSRFEGFPNTLVEAMAHGLPVVATDCVTGPADLISHNRDGFLVNPEAGVAGLAKCLQELMADTHLRNRLGEGARRVKERLAPDRISRCWLDLMDSDGLGP